MPTKPLSPCRTCGQVGCQAHLRTPWRHAWYTSEVPRVRGRKLQELRRRLFQQYPLCVLCLKEGRTSVSTIRDHVIPLGEGGKDKETNVQALCQACSDAKTQDEARRGQARVYPYA